MHGFPNRPGRRHPDSGYLDVDLQRSNGCIPQDPTALQGPRSTLELDESPEAADGKASPIRTVQGQWRRKDGGREGKGGPGRLRRALRQREGVAGCAHNQRDLEVPRRRCESTTAQPLQDVGLRCGSVGRRCEIHLETVKLGPHDAFTPPVAKQGRHLPDLDQQAGPAVSAAVGIGGTSGSR